MDLWNKLDKKLIKVALISALVGMIWLVALRFVIINKEEIHYHANFAVFVDGERLPFERFTFYEEIEACGSNGATSPKIRAHMHDQVNHVVHVHDNGATWGHFFANLGMTNGDTVFKTDTDTYVEDEDTQIRFLLNGEEVETTANRTIEDLDVLLISVGNPTEDVLQKQYSQIEQDAAVYNENDDPSACSGGKPYTLKERLKQAIGLFN